MNLPAPGYAKYDVGLDRNEANHVPLSPVGLLRRAAGIFPDRVAIVHGETSYTYAEFAARCARLASALEGRGIRPGDTVAIIAPNVPAMIEAHYGVPAIGAVLNPINVRLDAPAIANLLRHGDARALLVDSEYAPLAAAALASLDADLLVIDVADALCPGAPVGVVEYEALLYEGDPLRPLDGPDDEWRPIVLSYTSGTTGEPKGVVYHHRGAYLNAVANVAAWAMPKHPVMLWTLPIFHSLGWCFPWTLSLMGGTHVCLRSVTAPLMFELIERHGVTHMCGAPIVLSILIHARAEDVRSFPRRVQFMTAASPPPPTVIRQIEERGFDILHVYGLTEVFGPATICEWRDGYDDLPADEQARLKARQGVAYPSVDAVRVVDPTTMADVTPDGRTIGEVVVRSNTVMRGYLKNPAATTAAFADGWFHTGDLGVLHPDGDVELKDRSKDIIISGGENISTIEVETVLFAHPDIVEAAVVGRPHERWGETPCAFVTPAEGRTLTSEEVIAFCRERMPHFMAPTSVVFGTLPKTSTGKVQKFLLRERIREA